MKRARKLKKVKGSLNIAKLRGDVYWEVFCDAALGNINEGQSQIGYIVSLKDDSGRVCPIQWKSNRAKRVARSATEAEALSLMEAADMVRYLNEVWTEISGRSGSPVIIKTDSKTLKDAIKSRVPVKPRTLRIDMAGIKEILDKGEMTVVWVGKKEQLADSLTKDDASKDKLRRYMFACFVCFVRF